MAWAEIKKEVEMDIREKIKELGYTVNNSGYINFKNRNWSYKGDKLTWAKVNNDNDEIVVKVAANGCLSNAYEEEIRAFFENFNVDFVDIPCGSTTTVGMIK